MGTTVRIVWCRRRSSASRLPASFAMLRVSLGVVLVWFGVISEA